MSGKFFPLFFFFKKILDHSAETGTEVAAGSDV